MGGAAVLPGGLEAVLDTFCSLFESSPIPVVAECGPLCSSGMSGYGGEFCYGGSSSGDTGNWGDGCFTHAVVRVDNSL